MTQSTKGNKPMYLPVNIGLIDCIWVKFDGCNSWGLIE